MKTVQVVPRYPPRTGGVETHVKELSERLVERDHYVVVMTADDGDDVETRETRGGVEVIRHVGFAPSGAFHVAPSILRTLRRYNPDVVHGHNYHSLPVLFAAIGAGDARFVVTPHYHGRSATSFRNRLMSLYRPVGRWALLRADDVVAVSDWEREQLRNDLGIDATIIPNGIDIERYRDVEPSKREQPYLLTVGRLEEYKGVQHVIRALPDLPEYDLLVAGSGPYRKELEQIAIQQGVEDRVRFLGYVDDDDLPSLYAGADTYVTMSEFESFGITVGEALASGTPCIVLRRGALVDWETYGGVVGINSPDTESIYQAIRTVCSLDVPVDGIPVWDSHVEKLLNIY